MTRIKLPYKMRKLGTNYLTYPNIPTVSNEIEAIIEENRNDFEAETLNNLFEILSLLREVDHKIGLVDQLVLNSTTEEAMNEEWDEYE